MLTKQTIKQQMIDDISQMIIIGTLKKGDFLPSIRTMGTRYKVSRGTVLLVYKTLESLGYIQGHERSGYLVTGGFLPAASESKPVRTPSVATEKYPEEKKKTLEFSQWLGCSNRVQLPKHFIRRWFEESGTLSHPTNGELSDKNDQSLKKNLCRFIRISRGVTLQPEHLFLLPGLQEALLLIAKSIAVIRQQPVLLIEDPCPPNIRELFECLDFTVIPIGVDSEGIRVEDFPDSGADLIFTSPAHQFPMAIPLGESRRKMLNEWASRHDSLIIENDSFAMLGFGQSVIPTLSHRYPNPRIIYLTQLSELTGSGMNVSCIVAPQPLMQPLRTLAPLLVSDIHPLTRSLLSAFLESSRFMKYLTSSMQSRRQKAALALGGLQYLPEPCCHGQENASFYTFHADINELPEGLLDRYFFPVNLFRHPSRAGMYSNNTLVYPFGLLSCNEIEKINYQLRLSQQRSVTAG
ncbi:MULTISPECIES: PLP-dependent aminotransferase family protein [Tatumella]|uniref:aminotransferase-like domain-containing protein n=1 Tax=Tatumella TaxID=82986 RepID=UPI000472FC31|nr:MULTISPECIES: PLP-dependent aminotransferase family protein [Tatumella]